MPVIIINNKAMHDGTYYLANQNGKRLPHQLPATVKKKRYDFPMHARGGNSSLPYNPLHFWEMLVPLL